MNKTVEECKSVGRVFEDLVAAKLRALGYEVHQDLYVPYVRGGTKYTQIDIVAMNSQHIFTIECKCITGQVTGALADKYWVWQTSTHKGKICNPVRQSCSHGCALAANLGFYVPDFVVSKYSNVFPVNTGRIVCFEDLDVKLNALAIEIPIPWFNVDYARSKLQSWANPSGEVKQNHALYVNRCKNGDVSTPVRQMQGIPYYCVMAGDEVFYAFTDDNGVNIGTTDLNEAMLFDDEDTASVIASRIPTGEVCTLTLGGIELLSDVEDEFEGMLPSEIAEEIGARPW